MAQNFAPSRFEVTAAGNGRLSLRLDGDWVIGNTLPAADALYSTMKGFVNARELSFACGGLRRWDSRFISLLLNLISECEKHGIRVDKSGLPDGAQGLLRLAAAVPERTEARKTAAGIPCWKSLASGRWRQRPTPGRFWYLLARRA
ncbi:MAG: STAS domain-containing protein [Pseudomonadota bacterium]